MCSKRMSVFYKYLDHYQIGIPIPCWGELFEIEPFIYIVISIYLDEVEMLDDVESDVVDAELEVDTLKW